MQSPLSDFFFFFPCRAVVSVWRQLREPVTVKILINAPKAPSGTNIAYLMLTLKLSPGNSQRLQSQTLSDNAAHALARHVKAEHVRLDTSTAAEPRLLCTHMPGGPTAPIDWKNKQVKTRALMKQTLI